MSYCSEGMLLTRSVIFGSQLPNAFRAMTADLSDPFITSVRNASRLRTRHVRNPNGYWYQRLTPPALNRDVADQRLADRPEARFEKVAPALAYQSSSVFHDHLVLKFTNMIMLCGQKELADDIMEKTFERIKRTQLEKYHNAPDDEKFKIQLNPWRIFHGAVDNCKPVLALMPLRRGGVTYQVPVSITDVKAEWTALKWLILAARDKSHDEKIWNCIATELLNAYNNEGRVIKRKHDLHKQCEANKAYAHYRWSR